MNLSDLLELTSKTEYFSKLYEKNNFSRSNLNLNIYEPSIVCTLATIWKNSTAPILILTSTPKESLDIYNQLSLWLGKKAPIFRFAEVDEIPFERHSIDIISTQNRLNVLSALRRGFSNLFPPLVISSIQAASHYTLDRAVFDSSTITISCEENININDLSRQLIKMGYQRETLVDIPGSFCIRGGIVDIYTVSGTKPVRIELFGDRVDSIRLFDQNSQISFKTIRSIVIPPAKETLPSLVDKNSIFEKVSLIETEKLDTNQRTISNELGKAISGEKLNNLSFYAGFFLFGTIFDYLSSDSTTILIRSKYIEESAEKLDRRYKEIRDIKENRDVIPKNFPQTHIGWDFLSEILKSRAKKISLDYIGSQDEIQKTGLNPPFKILPIKYSDSKNSISNIKDLVSENNQIIAISNHSKRLVEIFSEESNFSDDLKEDAFFDKISFIRGQIPTGFLITTSSKNIILLSDAELFGIQKQIRYSKKRPKRKKILFQDLNPGTLVVHVEHGIAIFKGTKVMDEDGREFLILEYAEGDKLFVPTEHLDRIQIYQGSNDNNPKLTRLGTQEWIKVRARAKKATEQIAGELIDLYAKRESSSGIAFQPDTQWQDSLESSFPYYETEDQLITLNEVKEDMESSKPMDRLICGDVGFGKTEIALRSAFKAVQSGKQVSFLVPTTVLAQQHKETFEERLKPFPITIESLSRFTTKHDQKKILNECKKGAVDIIIGTHRILQKDVGFKNLGLLIIDEEHKFGVEHKERLKQIKTDIDVLTLSATPIPRTLNMSLSGVRDLSTINTPPEQRLPIKTYISENDDSLIKEAILREFDRGGQVYFVFNRVKGIEEFSSNLAKLVPEVKIKFAHGKMDDSDLEKIMYDFGRNKFNVLVCTTIIESGIDNPNVNTIIIDRADRFGLSQLYQLRGRIGRGTTRSYAYLLIPKSATITESAEKRLNTILSATELGSGFQIALRDLEIRGIGNILGSEQSGQITAVGFELYSKLLSQAVERIKNINKETKNEILKNKSEFSTVSIDLSIDARIPDSFIEDLSLRLGIYQRLANLHSLQKLDDFMKEIKDRFGSFPKNVELLGIVTKIRILSDNSGIDRIVADDDLVKIIMIDPVGDAKTALSNILGDDTIVGNKHIKIKIDRENFNWLGKIIQKIKLIQDFRDRTIKALESGLIE